MVGILHAEALVGKESELVVLKHHAHAMTRPPQLQGHVGAGKHRASGVLKACGVALIARVDGELRRSACRRRVELRLQLPVVQKSRFLLRHGLRGRCCENDAYGGHPSAKGSAL
jgi:hypothetical protein